MRIARIAAYPLRCALKQPFAYSQKWFRYRTALLVKVTTDAGIVGWGEAFCHDAGPAIAALLERVYQPLVVGQDALAREVIWDRIYNHTRDYGQRGLTTIALSGLDIALWDIAGKVANLPVCSLLGGSFRDRVPAYATGMYLTEPAQEDPAILADEAASYVAQGFRAVKIKIGFGLHPDVEFVRRVRAAIGEAPGLMVDANHAYDVASAIAVGRAIEPYRIGWFEEPVVPEDIEGYCTVRRNLAIPIAGGEAEFTRYGFRSLITQAAVDILQPDLCSAGGISEGLKIAALARAWNTRLTPHVWGAGLAIAAALHFIAALPDQPPSLNPAPALLELDRTENPLREELLVAPLQIADGCVHVPQGPGLGIEVNEDALAAYRFG
jgi:D-galactarolactone cycloisomerase